MRTQASLKERLGTAKPWPMYEQPVVYPRGRGVNSHLSAIEKCAKVLHHRIAA